MNFKGGETAPRTGAYALAVPDGTNLEPLINGLVVDGKIQRTDGKIAFRTINGRQALSAHVEAGEKFPGDETYVYEVGELKQGERVPRAGVYFCMGTHTEHALKDGDVFPDADGDPKHADDFVYIREK